MSRGFDDRSNRQYLRGTVSHRQGRLAIRADPFSATIVSVVTLGVLFLVAAGAQFAAAIMAPTWRGFFLFLLLGALYCGAGVYSVTYPMEAAAGVTVMLVFLFLAGGAFRIAISLVERFPSWGWTLA